MFIRIAGIDVHKQMLAVVVAEIHTDGNDSVQSRRFGSTPAQLQQMATWFLQQHVQEVVMESTAQYWRPVWDTLERLWQPAVTGKLYLAQARSNRGARGRKNDFADAERLVRRLLAKELVLSFVPDAEQRRWRTATRARQQLSCARVRLQNQLEALLEEAHIKLSSLVSDLLGVSGQRMLRAIAAGETEVAKIAALADRNLRATQESLCDALGAAATLHPAYRQLLRMRLEELDLVNRQMEEMEQLAASLMTAHQDAIERLAEVPGLRVCAAQQIVAELGPQAAAFPSARALASWAGVCPGREESAGVSSSSRSPKGNTHLRRLLNQAAHSAVKVKGSIFELHFRRKRGRMGYKPAIGAIGHLLCRIIWTILHGGVRYEERGPEVNAVRQRVRATRMKRELMKLGYTVISPSTESLARV